VRVLLYRQKFQDAALVKHDVWKIYLKQIGGETLS